jgi:hypothetical protein
MSGTARTRGTVKDIRTGRAVKHDVDLTDAFIEHIALLKRQGLKFYVVAGPCRNREARDCVDILRANGGILVIMDRQFKSDTLWIFEGEPHELGFAS